MKRSMIFAGLLFLVAFYLSGVALAEDGMPFPITKDVPCVICWEEIGSENPAPYFVYKYHRAPDFERNLGPFGLSVWAKEIPELGAVYQIWNMGKNDDGSYNFGSATYAHQLDNQFWLVSPSSFIMKAGIGYKDVVTAMVYRREISSSPKLGGREKVVAEYRVRYSTKTITSVLVKIIDPHDPAKEVYWFEISLAGTPIGERIIKKEEVLMENK